MADIYKIEKSARGGFTAFERDDGRWEIDRPGRNERFELSRDGSTFSITERDDGITKKDIYTDKNNDGIFAFKRTEALGRDSRSRDDSYKVDSLTGGRINVFEWDDGRWQLERPDRNETFRLSSNGRIFTRIDFEKRGKEVSIYNDENGDGVFNFVRTRFEGLSSEPNRQKSAFSPSNTELIPTIDNLI